MKVAVGEMLQEAMRRKANELGGQYSYRDLERDSGVNYSYASKVIHGTQRPSRDVVHAWSRALAPYLPLDEALVAAGYLPTDSRKARVIEHIVRLTAEQWEELERRVFRFTLEEAPGPEAKGEGERADEPSADDEPDLDADRGAGA